MDELITKATAGLAACLPALAVLAFATLVVWVLHRRQTARVELHGPEARLTGQVGIVFAVLLGVVFLVLAMPVSEATRGQVLSLLGVLLTAIIALSSTTFVSNAMAGFMLRSVNNFRPGDFVRIGDLFGRVTERGFFHTEVQTEDRDLTTFPNLYFVNNPVTVVRRSGTIVSAAVSLGYDVPRSRIEELLKHAAAEAKLDEAFVHITDLGDFSISYRVAGFLENTDQILTARSNLRKKMIDELHDAGIEIVSPSFMNQIRREPGDKVIPKQVTKVLSEESAESLVFDKGSDAAEKEQLSERRAELKAAQKVVESSAPEAKVLAKEIKEIEAKIDTIKNKPAE
jgi:small-conductance mechanosensitive channel